jgi:tryptophan halogenase
MIQNVVALGGGSAGLIAALTLKRLLPELRVRVVRSPDIGVIGVGEGTIGSFPSYFFQTLRLKPAQLFAEAQPTWKLGVRFLWGPRSRFFYTFSRQLFHRRPDLPKNNGFYCEQEMENVDLWSALMARDKAFPRGPDNKPMLLNHDYVGFHIENKMLVSYLDARCRGTGVVITDGTVQMVEPGGDGVAALILENGERITADLFVDASGFRSELLARALQEPFRSYERSLFCDRAVVGGWPRTDEIIHPYTTAETMDAGWSWQIEHEHWINRGYVYSSRFLSDEAALAEFLAKNPKVATTPRVVKFRTGRFERNWIGNVVAIGNSSGFVEPLEASALAIIITQSRTLANALIDSSCDPTPTLVAMCNQFVAQTWDDTRDFIAVHYKFNTRLDTPFWRTCRAEVETCGAAPIVEFFEENGPSAMHEPVVIRPCHTFGIEGYLAMLVGQRVPYRKRHQPTSAETQTWRAHLADNVTKAARGFSVQETLAMIRDPAWTWVS